MWQFWLIASGIFFIIEIMTTGFLVFWFGIGALFTLLASLFIDNILIQGIIFTIVSSILLVFTKPLVNNFVKKSNAVPTNVNGIIGKNGTVLEDITDINDLGKVKVNGELWSAYADEPISKGTKVQIIGVDGVKLKVEKINVASKV